MNTPSLEPPDSAYRNFLHAVLFVLKGTVTLLQAATELYVALRATSALAQESNASPNTEHHPKYDINMSARSPILSAAASVQTECPGDEPLPAKKSMEPPMSKYSRSAALQLAKELGLKVRRG